MYAPGMGGGTAARDAAPVTILVMFAGQSNQYGVGTAIDGSDLPAYLADTEAPYANNEILIWKSSPQGGPAWFTLHNSKNNNGAWDDTASNWASEAQLSFELWQSTAFTKPIYLSKNAVSSTSIDDWLVTNMPSAVTAHFLPAVTAVLAEDPNAELWFVWHQGHSDNAATLDYADKLVELIDGAGGGYEGLRPALGLTAAQLNVIVVRGNDNWGPDATHDAWKNGRFQIRQAKGVAQMTNVYLMGNAFANGGDDIHLTPESYVGVGTDEMKIIAGTYGFSAPVVGSGQSVGDIPQDTPNGTLVITLSATDLGTPPGRWELTGTGAELFEVNPLNGEVRIVDQPSLTEQTYNLTATLYNGLTPSSKALDITIIAAAGLPDPIVLLDPNDAANYTLTGQGYSAINNQITPSQTWTQTTDARRPPQGTLANGKEFFDMADNGVMSGPNSETYFVDDVSTDFTMAFWCKPSTENTVAGQRFMFCLNEGSTPSWAIYYDRVNEKFGLRYQNASTNGNQTASESGTSARNTAYTIVAVKSVSEFKLYANGANILTLDTATNGVRGVIRIAAETPGNTVFGGQAVSAPHFHGQLGPVYLFDVALSDSQRGDLETILAAWAA